METPKQETFQTCRNSTPNEQHTIEIKGHHCAILLCPFREISEIAPSIIKLYCSIGIRYQNCLVLERQAWRRRIIDPVNPESLVFCYSRLNGKGVVTIFYRSFGTSSPVVFWILKRSCGADADVVHETLPLWVYNTRIIANEVCAPGSDPRPCNVK